MPYIPISKERGITAYMITGRLYIQVKDFQGNKGGKGNAIIYHVTGQF